MPGANERYRRRHVPLVLDLECPANFPNAINQADLKRSTPSALIHHIGDRPKAKLATIEQQSR
jgi:hypothetical protein